MEFFHKKTSFPFMATRKVWYTLSAILMIVSFASFYLRGLNFAVDFTGGITRAEGVEGRVTGGAVFCEAAHGKHHAVNHQPDDQKGPQPMEPHGEQPTAIAKSETATHVRVIAFAPHDILLCVSCSPGVRGLSLST